MSLALDVVAGQDRFESSGWKRALPPPKVRALRGLRVALWPSEQSVPTSGEISDRVQQVGNALARAGAIVSDRARPDVPARDIHRTYLSLIAASSLVNLPDDYYATTQRWAAALDPNDESPLAWVTRGRVLDHRSWSEHNEARTRFRLQWRAFFEDWDVVICPIFATTAFKHDQRPKLDRTLAVDAAQITHYEQYFWFSLATVAYLPSTAFPSGLSASGLPIGLQIIGPEYGDRTTIEVARLIAQELGGFRPPPGFSG